MPCRELRFCLWYFMWSTKIRKNRIRSISCQNQKKTPEIQRFQVLFWSALTKKMQEQSLVPQGFAGF